MSSVINIVITCTKRKSQPAPRELFLRNVRGSTTKERVRSWTRQIERSSAVICTAETLYCGEHWSIVRSLPTAAQNLGSAIRIWVCSAGYGLVPLDAKLKPYQATFAPGQPDSVPGRGDWWDLIANWPGPASKSPRTIAAIAKANPGSPLLVAASPHYLDAMSNDLLLASASLKQPEGLMIFSGNCRKTSELFKHWVPCSSQLQPSLAGSRTSLNVRVLRRILERFETAELKQPLVAAHLRRVASRLPEQEFIARQKVSDQEVRTFIANALRRETSSAGGRLLMKFRASGRACEYSRFQALHHSVLRELRIGR